MVSHSARATLHCSPASKMESGASGWPASLSSRRGGLQDEDEPRGAQFDLISAVVENEAVAWADDDDYGRTISQRDAVKLGLLAPSPSTANVRSLRAVADRSMRGTSIFTSTKASHKGKAKQSGGTRRAVPFRLEIESSEQVEDRLRLESLLRRRRLDLLRERGFSDERTPERVRLEAGRPTRGHVCPDASAHA